MWDQGASGSRQGQMEASPSLQGAFHGDEKLIRLLIPIPLSLSFGLAKYLSFTRQGFIQTSELTSEVGWGEEALGCKQALAHSFIHSFNPGRIFTERKPLVSGSLDQLQ